MNFSPLDLAVLVCYLLVVTIFGVRFAPRQHTTRDYFLGNRNLPWGAVAFSIVAAETSTLTVISIPGLAYISNLNFLQLTFGYLLGRVVISFMFLPAYARGELETAYQLMEHRFGTSMRQFTALIFQFTRLLADGVRLFATAIPLSIITGWSYPVSIAIIGLVTILYTYFGGIRAVVWLDVIQMSIYLGGAILAGMIILKSLPNGWDTVVSANQSLHKFDIFYLGLDKPLKEMFSINYTLFSGVLGGAFLSMASHGTDQLIVQKLLSCKDLRSSQKALIASGVLVILQFALFLLLGLLLFAYYGGVSMRSDEIFPRFVVTGLPQGVSGLIIAGIFAAAISSLSASLNSLSSTTVNDLIGNRLKNLSSAKELLLSRGITVGWGVIFMAGALFFKNKENPVVELGLGIASFTYGGMLGCFLLGVLTKRVREQHAMLGMFLTILFMIWLVQVDPWVKLGLVILHFLVGIWLMRHISESALRISGLLGVTTLYGLLAFLSPPAIAWPWYVLIGACVTFVLGNFLAFIDKNLLHF